MHTWTKSGYNNEDEDISLFCLAMPPLLLQQCCMDKAREKLMVIFTETCDATGLLCTISLTYWIKDDAPFCYCVSWDGPRTCNFLKNMSTNMSMTFLHSL